MARAAGFPVTSLVGILSVGSSGGSQVNPLQAGQLVVLSLIPPGWIIYSRSYLSCSSILVLDWTAEDLSVLGAMS